MGTSLRTGVALAALTAACFVSVTSENLPAALLPAFAAGFGVSGSAIGLLVTGYAIVVAVTVVPLVAGTASWDRRSTVLVTVTTIAVSNLLLAGAPDYGVAVLARVVSAVGHGVFWSVVAPIAARLLGPARAGRATAVVFAGNSLAFLFGLPLTAWLGATIGWRGTVLAVAVAAAASAVVIRATVDPLPPDRPRTGEHPMARRAAIRQVVADRSLAAVNVVTLAVVFGQFAVFTYITAIIADYVHVTGPATAGLLFGYGAAGLVGLVVLGRQVDGRPRATALIATGGLAATMLLLVTAGSISSVLAAVGIVVWALPAGGINVVLQAAVLRVARQPDLASSVYIVAYQIGIALGAAFGGLCLGHGILSVTVAVAGVCGLVAAVVVRRSIAFRGPVFVR